MVRMRDENNRWTHEAVKYTEDIDKLIQKMLDMGEQRGFSNEDIFYLIVTDVHEQQLMRLLWSEESSVASPTT